MLKQGDEGIYPPSALHRSAKTGGWRYISPSALDRSAETGGWRYISPISSRQECRNRGIKVYIPHQLYTGVPKQGDGGIYPPSALDRSAETGGWRYISPSALHPISFTQECRNRGMEVYIPHQLYTGVLKQGDGGIYPPSALDRSAETGG